MSEPLIENSQQNIPINPTDQGYSSNNEQYTGIQVTYDQNQQNQQMAPNCQNYQNQPTTNYPNQPYQSNELGPMFKENPKKPFPEPSGVSYGFSTIFSIYLVQSLIYIGLFFIFGLNSYEGSNILNAIFYAYIILSLVLFISIRKYMENYENSGCSVCLFILFFIFKICFYIILCNSLIDVENEIEIDKIILSLFYSNCAAGAIYICLIIYSCIKKDISLLISFGIGILITLIFLISLSLKYQMQLAVFVAGLVIIELLFLFISILIAKKTELLEDDSPIHNIVLIDYYKFFIIMFLSYLCVMLALLMLYCVCLILGSCASRPTSTDDKGNIYDQYGKSMGIKLKKKPHSYRDGKYYDKHGREIAEDTGCQIF